MATHTLSEDDVIQDFLWVDSCCKLADKVCRKLQMLLYVNFHLSLSLFLSLCCSLQYLLAMVYVYFRRAALPLEHYNRVNFFTAL